MVCFGATRIQILVFKVDLDPVKENDADPNLDLEQGSKWLRIRIRNPGCDPPELPLSFEKQLLSPILNILS